MDDAWAEALDLDDPDSDFPYVLRPCSTRPLSVPALSQLHSSPSPLQQTLNNNNNFPHLQQSPETLVVTSQPSTASRCGAKRSRLQTQSSDLQRSAVVCVQPRSIPGPAGAVLAALRRRSSEIRESEESEEEMPVLSTQEYLRKAVDGINGSNSEFDDDFKKPCWTAALDFAERGDGELASSPTTVPLGSIKNWGTRKLPKVVAMIKSLTPNGFGDFMVTLKDPSGTISASIHRSVVTEGNFGCYLSVDAVLVLQKVSIFAPRAEYYLNITHSNVVKIFPKDFESSSNSVSGLAAMANCRGSVAKAPMAHNSSHTGTQLPYRGKANEVGGTVSNFGRQPMGEQLQGNSSTSEAVFKSLRSIEKQNEATGDTTVLNSSADINNKAQAAFMDGNYPSALPHEQTGEANKMIHRASATAERIGANKQMQPLTSLNSLPQWTDKQLEELLVED